jgi:hypothetical protein
MDTSLPLRALLSEAVFRDRLDDAAAVLGRLGIPATIVRKSDARSGFGAIPGENTTALTLTSIQHAMAIRREGRAGPGLWLIPEAMRVSAWLPRFAAHALNADGIFLPWAMARTRCTAPPLFVRPDSGLKPFPGQVVDFEAAPGTANTPDTLERTYRVAPEEMVYLAPVQPAALFSIEWRVWIVDRAVVAWSAYTWSTPDTPPAPPGPLPPPVRALAETLARAPWQPDTAWVLDAVLAGDEARLVEVNATSTAGVYDANLDALLPALVTSLRREIAGTD